MSDTKRRATDFTGTMPVSNVVVEVVSDATAHDPTDLEPLFDVVDPDALESLFEPGPTDGPRPLSISFRYGGCRVSVSRTGEVIATPESEL